MCTVFEILRRAAGDLFRLGFEQRVRDGGRDGMEAVESVSGSSGDDADMLR